MLYAALERRSSTVVRTGGLAARSKASGRGRPLHMESGGIDGQQVPRRSRRFAAADKSFEDLSGFDCNRMMIWVYWRYCRSRIKSL